ncbi:probable cytochrome P450 308a1 [Toxorhynchites rutilus septentrionalis]|uniref:probable cytochrome P450 308a1 n=1 Tax=Toxorhynchites rutilus septentrionalis TaxID=329112 RepID=UPI00247AFAB8|nr:probable cytochrome P450 308a1 [Toxorhynchites rutilus septentrionalis]
MIELCIALSVLAACLYFKWSCSYWRRVGNIDGPQPLPFFGNVFEQLIAKKHYDDIYDDIYRSYPSALWVGIYELFNKPAVVVRDMDLVKEILVSNFQSYNKNSFRVDETIDPLIAMNPFTQSGDKWKQRRSQITPVFSTAKIRAVVPIIKNITENFLEHVTSNRVICPDFEANDICAKYTIDVVASCAFGIDAESFHNPDAEFRRNGLAVFKSDSLVAWLRPFLTHFAPWLSSMLKLPFVPRDVDRWFRAVIGEVMRQRRDGEIKRQDLFQAIYDSLSQNGTIDVNATEIVGHSVTFLIEGFETSSILMSYMLYELAANQEIQDKVLDEVDSVLKECNGTLTDEAL